MLRKTISSSLIIVMLTVSTLPAFAADRTVASTRKAEKEFMNEVYRIAETGEGDFEKLIQNALGAGWNFEDDKYFEGYKKISGPASQLQFSPGLQDVEVLVKVFPAGEKGFKVSLITTTEKLAKEKKFYEARTIKISPSVSDIENRMHWEETLLNLVNATVIAAQKAAEKGSQDKIKDSKNLTCIIARWSAFAVVGTIFFFIGQAGAKFSGSYSKAGGIALSSLFGITGGLMLGYILVDSICTGRPVPKLL